ncbi:MAG: SDR family oxidoreductase [Spirochaetia bacterium]|nr:SDR family oxidoreductase [Spirochaetia bacterium]
MDKERFLKKVCIVTGGAGEIGISTAIRLAQEGADIALVDLKGMEKAIERIKKTGVRCIGYTCNVTNYSEVEKTVAAIRADFSHIDMLFNNAGIQGEFSQIHTYPVEDFHKVIEVNLIGAFHVLRAVSAVMVEQKFGVIVNTASMAGVGGPVNMAAYGASKFALVGLTQTASKDLALYNIRVNSISPGYMGPGYMWDRQVDLQALAGSQYYDKDRNVVAKQMVSEVPLRRYGSIDEIPGTVAYLMSDDASFITGVNIKISGGI